MGVGQSDARQSRCEVSDEAEPQDRWLPNQW
jgi:hypothetical protein